MYDSRLRQANQIYDEVKRHFQELVFNSVIQRNVKLSEAPSYGIPTILYDADSTGAKTISPLPKRLSTEINNRRRYGNTKRNALGRGLDALLSMDDVKTEGSSSISEIELAKITVNPNQPRREFDQTALQELADSIAEIGIIQPITLRKLSDDEYQIIAGERRYRASQKQD